MTPPLLLATELGRRVGGRWLWRGLGVVLEPGEALAVTGPSGSGKTLLLRTMAGLDAVDEGDVRLEGRSIESWAMPDYRARVAYLPQRPAVLAATVEADLRVPFRLRAHRDRPFPRDEALRLVGRVGRGPGFLTQPTASLSGGEGQLLAIVRALLVRPRVLLLDEPTASLDDDTARQVEDLVRGWQAEDAARAVVWTSHRAEQLARMTTRRVALTGGAG